LAQLLYRCSSGLSKQIRPGSSSQVIAGTWPPGRPRGHASAPQGRSQPPAHPSGHHGPQHLTKRLVRYECRPAPLPPRQTWAFEPNHCPPPKPPEAGGPGIEASGPAVSYFSLDSSSFRPMGGFHLIPGVQASIPMPAPSLQPGQDGHHQRSSKGLSPEQGDIGPPCKRCNRACVSLPLHRPGCSTQHTFS